MQRIGLTLNLPLTHALTVLEFVAGLPGGEAEAEVAVGPDPGPSAATATPSAATSQSWTADLARQLDARLQPQARKALRFIVAKGPVVPFDDVAEHVGVTTEQLRGAMSSVSYSLGTAAFAGMAAPIDRDYHRRLYLINQGTRAAFASAYDGAED